MAKFSEIEQGFTEAFVNNTNSFFLVIGMWGRGVPNPSAPGLYNYSVGTLEDQNGNVVDTFYNIIIQDYEVTGSLSDEAFAHAVGFQKGKMLVPPGYSFKNFEYAYGFWLDPEEVKDWI